MRQRGLRVIGSRVAAVGGCLALALAILSGVSGAARAESGDPSAAIARCLATWKTTPERCIGIVGDACAETARSTADTVACYDREQGAWDRMLNGSYQRLLKELTPDQATHLRAMQRSWIETRDLTCRFYDTYYSGTMAQPMIAACANRETARRALLLLGFVEP